MTKTSKDKGTGCVSPFSLLVSEPFYYTQNKAVEQTKSPQSNPADPWPENFPAKPNQGKLNHSCPSDRKSENNCSLLKATEFRMVCYRALAQK